MPTATRSREMEGSTRAGDGAAVLLRSRQDLRGRVLVLAVLLGVYVLAVVLEPGDLPGWTPCLLKNLTGVDCPSCGFTRGFIAISHGDLGAAISLNVLSLPVYLLGLAAIPLLVFELATRRDVVERFLRRHAGAVVLGVVLAIALRYLALIA